MSVNNFFFLVTSVLFIATAAFFRIVDGAAPWYLVWPAIFSVFTIAITISSILCERKRACRMR